MIKKTMLQDSNPQTLLYSAQNIIFDLSGVLLLKKTAEEIAASPNPQSTMQAVNFLEVISLLRACKAAGHQLFVLSNMSSAQYESIKKDPEIASLFSFFDDIIISDMTAYQKPSPQIFRYLCDLYNLKPEDCVFIDDKEINLEGARTAEITRTILCQNFDLGHVKNQLISYGVLHQQSTCDIEIPTGRA